jgi:hypothetical protein
MGRKRKRRPGGWAIFIVIAFALMLLPSVDSGAKENQARAARPSAQEKKTLTRQEDYIIVRGRELRKTRNEKISNLSLFSSIAGEINPIPFQVDEVNPEGEWVLPMISPSFKDRSIEVDRDDDNGHLDENDELVFMVRDSGDRLAPDHYPPGAVAVDEIRLEDPIDGALAWVYLCSFSGKPPLSNVDYVIYQPLLDKMEQVNSSNFKIIYTPELPNSPSSLSIPGSKNILDRMKFRMQVKILGIPFSLEEADFSGELSLYKDGPIRVIRRIRSAIQLTKTFRTPSAAIESVLYDNASIVPFRIKILVSMKWFKKILQIKTRVGADFQNMHGWQVLTNVDPRWLRVDGKMDETEMGIKGEGFNWFLAKGPEGAFMIRAVLDRRPDGSFQESPLKASLYYMDDDTRLDPPESVPGESPQIGYWMDGVEDLGKGTFYVYAVMYFIKNYQEGIEANYLKISDQPIKVWTD